MRGVSGGFSDAQMRRYSRHILLPDVGGRGQARWLAAAVGVVVDGLAGRVALCYLVAAGVGTLWLEGALDRPVAAGEAVFPLGHEAVGRPLGAALQAALAHVNPDVVILAARPVGRTGDTWICPADRMGDTRLDPNGRDVAALDAAPGGPCPVVRTGDTVAVAGDGPTLPLATALARGAAAATQVLVGLLREGT